MREFLPFNYEQELYQRFQNLRQGSRSVDEYTTDFYGFLSRTNLNETAAQLVSRYIGGLRIQLQDVLNMFDPLSVSEAHQRAVQAETQLARRAAVVNRPPQTPGAAASSPAASPKTAVVPQTGWGNTGPAQGRGLGGLRCFGCGEFGHRQSECPNRAVDSRGLFIDDVGDKNLGPSEGPPVFDEYEDAAEVVEEVVTGDIGPVLMLRRSFLSPRVPDQTDWLRNNVFQSTCTIGGKVCTFIIDAGSCENVMSETAVSTLGLTTEPSPKPYKLAWLNKGVDITVSKRVLVAFSIGQTYCDEVFCDVVPMDACHLLLGRPWQFDWRVLHDGRANTYSFFFRGKKIVLLPTKPRLTDSGPKSQSTLLFRGSGQVIVDDTDGADSRTNLLDPGGDDAD